MTTATLPQQWRGRSGRVYVPADDRTVRVGGMASVRKVVGRGGPVGTSSPSDGVPLALKLWNEVDEDALEQLQAEARVLSELTAEGGELPCPRLYDLVGTPLVTGLVMDWCPADLEHWWRDKLSTPDAFGRLMAALAEAARRVGAFHATSRRLHGAPIAHGDLKPGNILLDADGRWLVSDFGAARVRPPDDPIGTSRIIAGTEGFVSPEALFHATRTHPAAADTWALGATAFALLTLRRVVLDGGPVPRNGTHSARFRPYRVHQVLDVYAREPGRFRGRALDPAAFSGADVLPEADHRTLRESVRGVFGADDPVREEALAEELGHVLERALAVDPARRYTEAGALAAAFERLTRTYIGLAAEVAPKRREADVDDLVKARDEAVSRTAALQEQVQGLNRRIAELQGELTQALARRSPEADAVAPVRHPTPPQVPFWLLVGLGTVLAVQVATLLGVVALLVIGLGA